jgi:hypothetical protein
MMNAFLDWDNPTLAIVADKSYGRGKIRQQIANEGFWLSFHPKAMPDNQFRTTPIFTQKEISLNGSSAR